MELFEIIQWPEIQTLMDKDGFAENSHLINDDKGIEAYGSSAYFVNKQWLDEATDTPKRKVYVVSTLVEYTDETPSDYHRVFANYHDAIAYKNSEVEDCMCGRDADDGDLIHDFSTLYEWRDWSGCSAVTICVEELELQ